ncbi:MAG: transcription-repair coupling factor [Ezakiella sp.]|nr:transcription-repair coupling factor [Ezakiella sp.]MDD7472108.1 transcription-repair coupling factor [Bacillota bacterium]MDY3923733.1 transcription-repair coupling factor [Ezakiella sp.]
MCNYGDILKKDNTVQNFLTAFYNKRPAIISGVNEDFLEELITLIAKGDRSFFAVFKNDLEARKMADLLNQNGIEADYLPQREKVYYDIKVINDSNSMQRLSVFKNILDKKAKIITLSLFTLYDKNLNLDFYKERIINLKISDTVDFEKLNKNLNSAGYKRVNYVEVRGEYSFRGDILDIFPMCDENLIRIEFYDDEVDTIRLVDVETRISTTHVDEIEVFPCNELLIDDLIKTDIINNIIESLKNENSPELKIKFKKILEYLNENNFTSEREILFAFYPEELKTRIFEVVEDYNVLFSYPDKLLYELNSFYDFLDNEYKHLLTSSEIVEQNIIKDRLYDPFEIKKLKDRAFYILDLPKTAEGIETYHLNFNSIRKYKRDYNEIFKDATAYLKENYRVYFSAGDQLRQKDLIEQFEKRGYSYSINDTTGDFVILKERVREGFILPDIGVVVFGENNVFGFSEGKRKKSKSKSSSKLRMEDISIGDFVIHEDHGVGEYNGIKTLTIKDVSKDYIEILYKDNDKLYVPVENIDLIDKYTAKDGVKPRIYNLDSIQWKKTKEKAKKAVNQMAKELIELYAKRSEKEGFIFSKDTPIQKEFEDDFKYVETDGQLIAIDEIKADMESSRPMDRLLLGDVGYGKTEVAFRAAFKAIMDGKQVAMITPTTLLCNQHAETARERFKNFPIIIKDVSRFRTKKQVTETLKGLREGRVDFVIGTHRLLSNDVVFRDLGLLIVDEEQRFGVKHKEKIKTMSENVDVLTLSATPIPRTLSMSLSGIRSMSTIDEPPLNRIPVQTYVLEYNDGLIRNAILKEIKRGGQVFFLYNDVKSMEFMKANLETLVPEARFFIANGQMPERQLEDVFKRFEEKEADVLITSTIIETGMDLPNVNTLIVYNSDRFGLSTLYQLRGRVGRSNLLAYAYFTYKNGNSISEKASKRLMAMKEFTDFGSGYKIAMRDLEFRGAGNVLGLSQSGHMAEIGYDLYMKYLNYAIGELKGKPIEAKTNTKVDINVESAVNKEFFDDDYLQMEFYRRISELETFKDKEDLTAEVIDRFGKVPPELENLMHIGLIKNIASNHHIKSIIQNDDTIRIEYELEFLDKFNMKNFLNMMEDIVRIDTKLPIIRLKVKDNPIVVLYEFYKYGFDID